MIFLKYPDIFLSLGELKEIEDFVIFEISRKLPIGLSDTLSFIIGILRGIL